MMVSFRMHKGSAKVAEKERFSKDKIEDYI